MITNEQLNSQLSEVQRNQLNQLLQNYEEVFKEVNTLLLVRSQDHKIVLKKKYRSCFSETIQVSILLEECHTGVG